MSKIEWLARPGTTPVSWNVDIVTLLCYTRIQEVKTTMTKRGTENPNWQGGKTISSHGYVLIRVGTEHHLSDVRGYAYEHRIVAEKKIGRCLKPGEMIHHINNDKADNRPENLIVVGGNAYHHVHHRKNEERKLPGEHNPMISCTCGCGVMFLKYDASGRPRKYVSGHNPHPAKTQTEILRILERGGMHRNQLARLCGKSVQSIATALSLMKSKGLITQVGRGVWTKLEERNDNVKD